MGQLLTRSTESKQENILKEAEENFDHLFRAVELGKVQPLEHFINSRPEVKLEEIRRKGKSLLHIAVQYHQLDCIQFLLDLGFDANIQDDYGDTPLLELIENKVNDKACISEHNPKCLELQLSLLLKFKADINARSTLKRTVLLKSIIYAKYPLSKLLLDNGADPNIGDEDGLLPVHVCATNLCLSLLKQILDCGADINGCDNNGRTALYFSVRASHREIFDELIYHKCDIGKGSKYGFPLQIAIVLGQLEMVQILLENGADVQAKIYEHRLNPYSKVYDYLNLALVIAHNHITSPALSVEKTKRSLQILHLIVQSAANSTKKIGKNLFVKSRYQPFEDENLLFLNKMIALILHKLAFLYKMEKNCKPLEGLPKLNDDVKTDSLQNICRMRVRQLMCESRTNIIFAIEQVHCPRLSKDMILLKDI